MEPGRRCFQWKRLAAQVWDGMRTNLSDWDRLSLYKLLDVKLREYDGDCLPALLNIDGISK
jgi:hypothetical protein